MHLKLVQNGSNIFWDGMVQEHPQCCLMAGPLACLQTRYVGDACRIFLFLFADEKTFGVSWSWHTTKAASPACAGACCNNSQCMPFKTTPLPRVQLGMRQLVRRRAAVSLRSHRSSSTHRIMSGTLKYLQCDQADQGGRLVDKKQHGSMDQHGTVATLELFIGELTICVSNLVTLD